MPILFIASSKSLSHWGADVGLGKQLFRIGLAADADALASWPGTHCAGASDWTIVKKDVIETAPEEAVLLQALRDKTVDPSYYPRLRGDCGIVKIRQGAVENFKLVALALKGEQPDKVTVRASDIYAWLLEQAHKALRTLAERAPH